MIVGIGIDIVEVSRIGERLAERILGPREKEIFSSRGRKVEFLAGRFALKEAFFKALRTGLNGHSFTDVEFLEEKGKPVVLLRKDFGLFNFVHASLSHDEFVVAIVILEKLKGNIFVKGDLDVLRQHFEVVGKNGEEWEIETDLPPYALRRRLEEMRCELTRYGNVLLEVSRYPE